MLNLNQKKSKPGTFYALAFCVHIICFVMVCVGAFTPNWSEIKEFDGTNDVTYNRGLVVTCDKPGTTGCEADTNFGSRSGELLSAFIIVIFAIILGFLTLQLFVVGQCVRSVREHNLGIPLTALSIIVAVLLIAALALFEVSITKETTTGYSHRNDTFGFSRGIIVGSIILYFFASFFSVGEHFKRQHPPGIGDLHKNGRRGDVIGHYNMSKRSSFNDGPSNSNDTYYRNRGSYHTNSHGKSASANVANIGRLSLWR